MGYLMMRPALFFVLVFHFILIDGAILRKGNPLSWQEAKPHLKAIRRSGVMQFFNHYHRVKQIKSPKFLWGDELEYGIFSYDNRTDTYDLAVNRGVNMLEDLEQEEKKKMDLPLGCIWQPEYGSWMVEAVPRIPYAGFVSSLLHVEDSMQLRRIRLHSMLSKAEIAPSLTSFPLMGVTGLPHSNRFLGDNISNSSLVGDALINPHPRFLTLTRNIRLRRGINVNITVPLERKIFGNISAHGDAMAFGMGSCCLQITLQCSSDRESRFLHDQLAVLSPYFLSLSAATPIFNGKLADTDTRWHQISQSVDDRTSCELGECEPFVLDCNLVGDGIKRITKSRYSSVSRFIGKILTDVESIAMGKLNDIPAEIDENLYDEIIDDMKSKGQVDNNLAAHIAHLFIRDPLVIFDDAIQLDDNQCLDHFENIQSTNWRTIRWKTPSLGIGLQLRQKTSLYSRFFAFFRSKDIEDDNEIVSDISPGWRVEFRPLEIQLTDFENAAFANLVVLISRAILAMGYNFYIPLSLVEENMRRAETIDSVKNLKFYFNRRAFESTFKCTETDELAKLPQSEDIVELSIHDIFNGNKKIHESFIGLIPSVIKYLDDLKVHPDHILKIKNYLDLLSMRASGKLPTAARFIREFVKSHPKYMNDGIVNFQINKDLLKYCDDIGMGTVNCNKLFGDKFRIKRLNVDESKEVYLSSNMDNISQN